VFSSLERKNQVRAPKYLPGSREKQTAQSLFECRQVIGLTFPNDMRTPSQIGERLLYLAVARDIAVKFGFPEFSTALGRVGETAAWVAMPEAAMNQNGDPSARQDDVGSARKVATVEPEAQAQLVQNSPNGDLGGGIPLPDSCHHSASLRRDRLIPP
jgi:hypothetical protein